jgi:POT family proton-dependent oligopeptide transporter
MSQPPTPPNSDTPIHDPEFTDPAMHSLGEGPGAPIRKRQPAGLYVLFLVEMWERFSFYGMKALLGVFLVTIISAMALPNGVYPTRLRFEDKTNSKSTYRTQHLVIGDAAFTPGTPGEPQAGALKIDPPIDTLITGPAGGPFSNDSTEYTITNTSDKEVEDGFTIERADGKDGHQVYVTINEGTTPVTGKLKPAGDPKGEDKVTLRVAINKDQSGLSWTKEEAGHLRSYHTSSVYLTPIVGGYLADRFLGTHRCLLIGGAIIAAGHFTMMGDTQTALYIGLILVVIGTGFFKSNVSTMVGQLFNQGDKRRDAAFTIFYMGINLGAFLGPILCGYLRTNHGWSWGFGAAGFGMVLGLIGYLALKRRYLGSIGDTPSHKVAVATGNTTLTFEEKQRVAVIFIMAFFVVFFWAAFEQASNSMNYFAMERTDRTLPAWLEWTVSPVKGPDGQVIGGPRLFPAEWFQSVNPLFILLLAPLFASVWVRLATRGREPSSPAKMAIGLITLGLGFVIMVLGAHATNDGQLKVSPLWIIGALFIHTCAELCLSPVGLSLVTKLAPLKFASLMMGIWFLANMAANFIAERLAGMTDKIAETGFLGIPGYAGFFLIFVIAPCAAGAVLVCLVPMLKKMMHGRG